ncbi:MAG: DUF2723 domain-containing protein [Verrucomicrobia bacterium]|nr:DUF2723 domain-containing protein [Verrucomicrobiota bacterium]
MNTKNPNIPQGKPQPTAPRKDSSRRAGGAQAAAPASAAGQPTTVPPLFRRIDYLTFGATTLLVFVGYLCTLAPDMTLQDSGELAVASMYAGIPHPPGYPVWTIYTWLFTLLPISNIAFRVGLSSAVAAAFACGIVALMVSRGSSMLMEGIPALKGIQESSRRLENAICVVAGFVAGMLIGFNGFMWSQAVIVEVYTLSVLSLAGVMLCLLRWIYAPHQHRYLYLAFFWYGITFNNHQSLLVIAIGLEIAILVTQANLGRDLLFWNVLIWIGGLIGRKMGLVGVLNDNPPLLLIYNCIGLGSLVAWVWLVARTRKSWIELGRDGAMVASAAYGLLLFGHITSYATLFYRGNSLSVSAGSFVLFNLVGLGCIALFVHLIRQTRHMGREWLKTLACGGSWSVGAAFYLYMPLAGMSNPPLQWGYPRTVEGFFHAFTRGQYERIHPTFGQGSFLADLQRFIGQIGMYCSGVLEEFNLVYVLIGLIPFLYYKAMQKRERAWMIGVTAIYLCLSFFLLILLNPAPDRQSRDLNAVFFTASHVMVAMGIGYGLTLLAATLVAHFERYRQWALAGFGAAAMIALIGVAQTVWSTPNPVSRLTAYTGLALALAAVGVVALSKTRIHIKGLLAVFVLMPLWPIFSHWEDNEQHGHLFGYWFGHDMFTPPFTAPDGTLSYDRNLRAEMMKDPAKARLIYPEMDRDTVLYGGTDPGRFNPTYMIFCESFIPPSKKPHDPDFDRRDVYLITQNALADGTYLDYIRAQYNRSYQRHLEAIDPKYLPFFQQLLRGAREKQLNIHTNFIARMAIPLDRFFLWLGDDVIEKNRRAGSSYFSRSDFLDIKSFAAKLHNGGRSELTRYLHGRLGDRTRQLLGADASDEALTAALARDLNQFLEDELAATQRLGRARAEAQSVDAELAKLRDPSASDAVKANREPRIAELEERQKALASEMDTLAAVTPFHATNRFAGIALKDTTRRFIRENPQSHTRIRLNRLLLEEAFPQDLATSPGGVYPDREILTATPEDSQRAFSEYLTDAQRRLKENKLRPGEDVRMIDNRVQVSGQVAVMAINALITKIMFDKNPDHEFYVEESFPLEWMYRHLTPSGIIMKINRQPLLELTEEVCQRDHYFWSEYSQRLIGNWITNETPVSAICAFAEKVYIRRDYRNEKVDPRFVRDDDAQKAFSKLRSSIAGVYNWRFADASNKLIAMQSRPPAEQQARIPEIQRLSLEQQRMLREADFAFKQAFAYCPYSPEAVFRYVTLLVNVRRIDDALLIAQTAIKLDPDNGQIAGLIVELERIQKSQPAPPPAAPSPAAAAPTPHQTAELETQFHANPAHLGAASQLIETYFRQQQPVKIAAAIDRILQATNLDRNALVYAAQVCDRLRDLNRMQLALQKLVVQSPQDPEAWFDLAGVQVLLGNHPGSISALRQALTFSAQRLRSQPQARDLYRELATNTHFAALHPLPDYQKLIAELKPKNDGERP